MFQGPAGGRRIIVFIKLTLHCMGGLDIEMMCKAYRNVPNYYILGYIDVIICLLSNDTSEPKI
jgi:hypothetical protein